MDALNSKGPTKLTASVESLTIAQYNQTNSPLLSLPAEIRNIIYTFTLDLDMGIYHDASDEEFASDEDFEMTQPLWDPIDFVRTSHQIYAETAHIYFDTKILPFLIHDSITLPNDETDTMNAILAKLTPLQKAMVTHVHFASYRLYKNRRRVDVACPLLDLPNLVQVTYCKRGPIQRVSFVVIERWRTRVCNRDLWVDVCELERPSLELM